MPKAARKGRPKKPIHQKRVHQLSFRLTLAERDLFQTAAASADPPAAVSTIIVHLAKQQLLKQLETA